MQRVSNTGGGLLGSLQLVESFRYFHLWALRFWGSARAEPTTTRQPAPVARQGAAAAWCTPSAAPHSKGGFGDPHPGAPRMWSSVFFGAGVGGEALSTPNIINQRLGQKGSCGCCSSYRCPFPPTTMEEKPRRSEDRLTPSWDSPKYLLFLAECRQNSWLNL